MIRIGAVVAATIAGVAPYRWPPPDVNAVYSGTNART
jgi:hypothetical protein